MSSSEFSGFRGEVSRPIFLLMELAAAAPPAAPPAGAPPCAAHTALAQSITAAASAILSLMYPCQCITSTTAAPPACRLHQWPAPFGPPDANDKQVARP